MSSSPLLPSPYFFFFFCTKLLLRFYSYTTYLSISTYHVFLDRFGYTIIVVSLLNFSKDKVLPGSGLAKFCVIYRTIVLKPYKGEVLDAVTSTVNRGGCGPVQDCVPSHPIPNDMRYNPNSTPPCYSTDDQAIHKDAKARFKLVGTLFDTNEILSRELTDPSALLFSLLLGPSRKTI
ncbi:hypothetical protein BCR42DRAFT_389109 [Absidia repens]|uniref:Uncharacterized protein n=1 Tax=Absidia repens TaxID=90262 RepID=A0A1X2IS73_9FUNG|nr:hypothetical protein BCR42DRAFT_389109 [Absidia repens]